MNKISIIISNKVGSQHKYCSFYLYPILFIAFFTFNLFIYDIINLVIHRDSQNHILDISMLFQKKHFGISKVDFCRFRRIETSYWPGWLLLSGFLKNPEKSIKQILDSLLPSRSLEIFASDLIKKSKLNPKLS